MKQRIIALIDCDSFFVSCERVDNPELRNLPVCVMTGNESKGIIISRSKEAKAVMGAIQLYGLSAAQGNTLKIKRL